MRDFITTGCSRLVAVRILRSVTVILLVLLVACHTGVYHTVESGQTLYRISQTYGVDSTYLARINNISDPTQLRAGTRLYIPGASRQQKVDVVTAPRPTPPTASRPSPPVSHTPPPTPASQPASPPPQTSPRTSAPATDRSAATTTTPAAQTSLPERKFQWPLRGKIVRQFSTTAQAGSGRGIEIAVKSGSDVSAAEAGRVIYSGDGVSGYGFLVILQHEHEMFTVYGFNQRNLVAQGAFVSRGERIALSGVPPSGGEPRLHFEVRRGKEPVNPLLYLP